MSSRPLTSIINAYHNNADKLDTLMYNIDYLTVDCPIHECSYNVIDKIMNDYTSILNVECTNAVGSEFIAYIINTYSKDRYKLVGIVSKELVEEISVLLDDTKVRIIHEYHKSHQPIVYEFGMSTKDLSIYDPSSLTKLYIRTLDDRVVEHLIAIKHPLVFDASKVSDIELGICVNTACKVVVKGTLSDFLFMRDNVVQILDDSGVEYYCTTVADTYQDFVKGYKFNVKRASELRVGNTHISMKRHYKELRIIEEKYYPNIMNILYDFIM